MSHDPIQQKAGKDFTAGGILALPKRHSTTGDPAFDKRVEELVADWKGSANSEMIEELIISMLRLARQEPDIAELKLLNRACKELRNAWRVFRPYDNRRKIAIYGSARTNPESPDAKAAATFARRMVEEGFMVITGAGDGIMGAAQKGAGRDNSFGLNIRLPFEQSANETIDGDPKLVTFNYFFTRKLTFVKESEAIALFPGGFGTMDEGFEVLTLIQTGKCGIMPIVLVDTPGGGYWQMFEKFLRDQFLARKLISPEDFSLFKITDNIEDAVAEVKQFYRLFHSYRFVKDRLVFRLQKSITTERLAVLNIEFADLVKVGSMTQQDSCLPEEAEEENLAHLPRLIFTPHRRNYGRFRQFIDALNKS